MSKNVNMKNPSMEQHSGENNRHGEPTRTSNKDSLWCTYCKKSRHTKDRCWKLHGRPQNFFDRSGQKQAYTAKIQPDNKDSPNSQEKLNVAFNSEELKKLKNLLVTLEKSSNSGTCSLAFTGITSIPHAFKVLGKDSSSAWVIDSGATDHMTYSSQKFMSYTPCPSIRKITIADGSITTVAGQGDICINNSYHT